MKSALYRHLLAFRHSRAFLGLALGLAWLCFYCVLLSSGVSGGSLMNKVIPRSRYPSALDHPSNGTQDTVDPFEQEVRLSLTELRMSSLQPILQGVFGLRLTYPASQRSLKLDTTKSTGKCMAEILLDLLRPIGFGFFRQGKYVYVTESILKQERKEGEKGEASPFQASLVRMTLHAKVGEPLDIWVDRDPLMRLEIEAQPFYGESQSGSTPDLIGFTVKGHRNQEPWFFQKMQTRLGEQAQIDVKAGGHMWCLLTPVTLEGNEITLKLEFYYETILPSA
jgi:hypothetical protein